MRLARDRVLERKQPLLQHPFDRRVSRSDPDLAAFEQVHVAWLAFRERYARFIAQSYSGGSIQPLIHAVTLESITAAWIAELETQLGNEEEEAWAIS